MKKIWSYLLQHFRQDFSPSYYFSVGLLLASLLLFNYSFDFEDMYLESLKGLSRWLAYFVFYGIGYLLTVIILVALKKEKSLLTNKFFWLRSLFGLMVLSLDSSTPYLRDFINDHTAADLSYWSFKVTVNGISFFTVLLPLLIFYWYFDKREGDYYGLRNQRNDLKPYWFLLAIMIPLLFSASFLEGFQQQYPMYKTSSAHVYLQVPEWVTVLCYEIAYGLDFITVELLFRGFFVIGMIKVMGRSAVLPMAVIYCMLHFGKPAGEAISSIAGGYILGVIAYETRSVWGGIIVHMGIAWLMELIAFGQKLLNN
jgi:hypothetical protein